MSELLYRIALSMVPGIDARAVRIMRKEGITEEMFFREDPHNLAISLKLPHTLSVAEVRAALERAGKEMDFIAKHNIKAISIFDEHEYPYRLRECYDAPVMFYMLGDCDLQARHMLAIVGTRKATSYGLKLCETAIREMSEMRLAPSPTVISGLAYGIDACAHKEALKRGFPTVAVLAHGLDTIYPAQHRSLAAQIVHEGGALISEYPSGVKGFRRNFLERNRIVAGLSDAVWVVESGRRGGAMSTARLALEYDRALLALPGRYGDEQSAGCNDMLRANRAQMAGTAIEIADAAGWEYISRDVDATQGSIFDGGDEKETALLELLRIEARAMNLDELCRRLNIAMPELMAMLSDMEFEGKVNRLPGNKFSL